jgi:putative ABC transport system permease protein
MVIYRYNRLNITNEGAPDALLAGAVSADFFPVLGVRPLAGRTFVAGDDEEGRGKIAVLGKRLRKSRFGGDPGVVGRSVVLNHEPYTIVGIVQQRLTFPESVQLWIPPDRGRIRIGSGSDQDPIPWY